MRVCVHQRARIHAASLVEGIESCGPGARCLQTQNPSCSPLLQIAFSESKGLFVIHGVQRGNSPYIVHCTGIRAPLSSCGPRVASEWHDRRYAQSIQRGGRLCTSVSRHRSGSDAAGWLGPVWTQRYSRLALVAHVVLTFCNLGPETRKFLVALRKRVGELYVLLLWFLFVGDRYLRGTISGHVSLSACS